MKAIFSFLILSLFVNKASAQNYEEAKVPAYTLPEVLLTLNKGKLTSKASWENGRRKEIINLFEEHVYGRMPVQYDSMHHFITNENAAAMAGRAHLKQVQIEVFASNRSVKINMVLFVPKNNSRPAPVFLLINNRDSTNMDPTRKINSDFWPAEMLIDSGYAIAAFQVNDLAPDNKDSFQNGVLQLYPDQLNVANGMKTIGAWAWGAGRVMDYFKKDADIDNKKVVVIGHSRGGKAALWAGAQDQRFAIVVSNCSGNTGAALARRRFGETIKRINDHFPHWFCDNYKKYNDNEDALPVDQHMLIALMAPRPVYVGTATKDLWADPLGSFLALKHAEKIFSLYGIDTMPVSKQPGINLPIIRSPLGYHLREGVHNLTRDDWINYVKFANYHFKKN